ncbi:MAG: MerR family transcriptional regulator [Coprobacillus sp.]
MLQSFQKTYTTGQFAKLCHTTKDTLFHYDQLGILKPMIIKDNGYRYYGSFQYYEFDLIKVLQEAQTSLKEIKEFMENRNEEIFISILQSKFLLLEEEKKKIENMQRRITNAIDVTEYGMNIREQDISIQHLEEKHIIASPVYGHPLNENAIMNFMSDHLSYCHQKNLIEDIPLGGIIPYESIVQKNYRESYYFCYLDKKIKDQRYQIKPKGLYAIIYHHGYYDTLNDTFMKLDQYIEKQGYRICGNAYEYEILNYFTRRDIKNYLIEITVQVEKI